MLANGRGVALVDDEDEGLVSGLSWYFQNGYARADLPRPSNAKIYMHRLLLGQPIGLQVDHRNGNRLDNRRCNLRLASATQNAANSGPKPSNRSGFRGVSWFPRDRRWTVHIKVNGRAKNLGYFDDPVEAARVYDAAAVAAHGEFARLNFPGAGR